MNRYEGTALITGASSGIGAIYADRLARQGYDLILVARSAERLAHVADRVRRETSQTIATVAADLTDRRDIARIEGLLRNTANITMLVNNAGLGDTRPLLEADVDAMSGMIALNVEALMRLSYAVAPQFVERGYGTIVNVSSVVAVQPELLNGVYGATKAFVLAFSQSLRHELEPAGVRVQVVMPGATATEFWAIAGKPVTELPEAIVMSADHLVDAALAGLAEGEFATIPALPDNRQWDAFEAARLAMAGSLSSRVPAARYHLH